MSSIAQKIIDSFAKNDLLTILPSPVCIISLKRELLYLRLCHHVNACASMRVFQSLSVCTRTRAGISYVTGKLLRGVPSSAKRVSGMRVRAQCVCVCVFVCVCMCLPLSAALRHQEHEQCGGGQLERASPHLATSAHNQCAGQGR